MFRSMQLRFASVALIAATAVLFTAASAWAFSQQDFQPGGTANSTFGDPDDQFTNSGQGAHLFGPNGPVLQFGVQQGPMTPLGGFRGNGYDTLPADPLPDPYSHPLGNGD